MCEADAHVEAELVHIPHEPRDVLPGPGHEDPAHSGLRDPRQQPGVHVLVLLPPRQLGAGEYTDLPGGEDDLQLIGDHLLSDEDDLGPAEAGDEAGGGLRHRGGGEGRDKAGGQGRELTQFRTEQDVELTSEDDPEGVCLVNSAI